LRFLFQRNDVVFGSGSRERVTVNVASSWCGLPRKIEFWASLSEQASVADLTRRDIVKANELDRHLLIVYSVCRND